MCVDCLFLRSPPSSIPYRTHPACAKRAAYPDPPPVIPVPESIAAQAVYQLSVDCLFFKVTEPSSVPYRTLPTCAKMAMYPDPPPVIPLSVDCLFLRSPSQVPPRHRSCSFSQKEFLISFCRISIQSTIVPVSTFLFPY